MDSFFITAYLQTPVALRGDLILDGLIAGELAGFDASPERRAAAVEEAQSIFVTRKSSAGLIVACSVAIAESNNFSIAASKIRRFRWNEAVGCVAHDGIKNLRLTTHDNVTRNLFLEEYRPESMRALHWIVQGDADAIYAIVSKVSGLGFRRGDGFGLVTRWDITPVSGGEAAGFLDQSGDPVRPMPASEVSDSKSKRSIVSVRPFYYEAPKLECVVPARRKITFGDELFEFVQTTNQRPTDASRKEKIDVLL